MEIKQDWSKSKLSDYLLLDNWTPGNAFRILAGLDFFEPGDEFDPDFSLDGSVGFNSCNPDFKLSGDELRHLKAMCDIVDRLEYFWRSGQHGDHEVHPPEFFIQWAISKSHIPPWLDWATECGLYPQKQGAETITLKEKSAPFDWDKARASPTFPSELDMALQAWCAVSATEGKGKPKARIMAWLEQHASEFSNEARARIAIVANWDKNGGATRTDDK